MASHKNDSFLFPGAFVFHLHRLVFPKKVVVKRIENNYVVYEEYDNLTSDYVEKHALKNEFFPQKEPFLKLVEKIKLKEKEIKKTYESNTNYIVELLLEIDKELANIK